MILAMPGAPGLDESLVEVRIVEAGLRPPISLRRCFMVALMKMQLQREASVAVQVATSPGDEESKGIRVGVGELQVVTTLSALSPIEDNAR